MAGHLPFYAGGHAGSMPTVSPPVKHPAHLSRTISRLGRSDTTWDGQRSCERRRHARLCGMTSSPENEQLIPLRYPGKCAACGAVLTPGTKAWRNAASKVITCVACHQTVAGLEPSAAPASLAPSTVRPSAGIAGASARDEFDRRRMKREAAIDAKWGRFAGVVKFITDEPQTTEAWAKGAGGEERLAKALGARLTDDAIPLHDRKVPRTRGNIDHLVIGPTGVWIIDAKAYAGKIERRDKGGFFSSDMRLYVGGRDRSEAVAGMQWQVDAVRAVVGDESVPVHPVLCFTDAEWGLFSGPFTLGGVLCTYAKALAQAINASGPLDPARVVEIAQHLATSLPANTERPVEDD